jgi:hypothetical protein
MADVPDLKAQWEQVRHIERGWISKKPDPQPMSLAVFLRLTACHTGLPVIPEDQRRYDDFESDF